MLLVAAGAGGISLTTTSLTLIGSSPLVGCAQNEGLWLRKVDTDTWVCSEGPSDGEFAFGGCAVRQHSSGV